MNIDDINDILRLFTSKARVSDLVDNYICFLEEEVSPKQLNEYRVRLENNKGGSESEAVAYHFFKSKVEQVQVYETLNKGGIDFECQTDDSKFVAEVTHIDNESVSQMSGLKNELSSGSSARSYSKISPILYRTVERKASQMSGYECPGILIIACSHLHAGALLCIIDAEWLLVGDNKIELSAFKKAGGFTSINNITEMENSCFLRWNAGWEPAHRGISAILFFDVSGASAFVFGILHPDPKHEFLPKLLPSTPFVRLKKWPPGSGKFEIEWVKYENNELVVIPIPEPERLWYDSCLA